MMFIIVVYGWFFMNLSYITDVLYLNQQLLYYLIQKCIFYLKKYPTSCDRNVKFQKFVFLITIIKLVTSTTFNANLSQGLADSEI